MKVFQHNSSTHKYFTSLEQLKNSTNDEYLYSILGFIDYRFHFDEYGFLFMYTIPSLNGNNTFYQYIHPFNSTTTSTASDLGFKQIFSAWTEYYGEGFRKSRVSQSFFDISTGSNWNYPIGAKTYYLQNNTIPSTVINEMSISKPTNQLWIKLNPLKFTLSNIFCVRSYNNAIYFNIYSLNVLLSCVLVIP